MSFLKRRATHRVRMDSKRSWRTSISGGEPMQLTSLDFTSGGAIPTRFTCEGDNISPEFSWKEAPENTKSFALTIHDPDASRPGGYTHWVMYNIPAEKGGIEPNVPKREDVPGTGRQGQNDG